MDYGIFQPGPFLMVSDRTDRHTKMNFTKIAILVKFSMQKKFMFLGPS